MADSLSFDLKGRVVIITGAGRGIGKSVALACAAAGADVALGSRHPGECEKVAVECRSLGVHASSGMLDVSELDSIRAFLNAVLAEFGRVEPFLGTVKAEFF